MTTNKATKFPFPIFTGNESNQEIIDFLNEKSYSKIFVLVDQNTKKYCLPEIKELEHFKYYTLLIPSGETNKNLNTCQYLWDELTQNGADRESVIINLGGGVVTDLGGFVAATFKRGIDFINIPTTVLAMVDAAIGAKTGVDFKGLKNQIGVFRNPIALVINPIFLNTLPKRELLSGLAEIIKYGLIDKISIWEKINLMNPDNLNIDSTLIKDSIAIKTKIVLEDPQEKGIRKILNFGHTLGHAIETYFLEKKGEHLLHGEAVAIGMIMALHLSFQKKGFSSKDVENISRNIIKFYDGSIFPLPIIDKEAISKILLLLQHDKKNSNGKLNFILLESIGRPVINCHIATDSIVKAIAFYNSLITK